MSNQLGQRRKHNPMYSIQRNTKALVSILIPVIIINIAVSLLAITITRQQSISYISKTVELYLSDMKLKMGAIEHFIRWSILHENLIKNIEIAKDHGELVTAIHQFRTRVNDFQYSSGKEFQFFMALEDQNTFFNCSDLQISYLDYLKVKQFFLDKMHNETLIKDTNEWKSIKIDNAYYLYHMISYSNRTFICLISVEDILKPLQNINLGTNGFILMENANNDLLSTSSQLITAEKYNGNQFLRDHLVFNQNTTTLPFSLHVYIDRFGSFEWIVLVQISVIIMAIVIALTLWNLLFYMKKKVLKPIQDFSNNLAIINEGSDLLDLQSSSIIELEQANEQFKNLMREIKKLKINIYEQELEKKRIQIDFMQEQIKPHFYLNCLTSIYSMAQTQMYPEIEAMALSTSKYLRYLFQTNQDFVKLEYELNHINNYLAIQNLRYGSAFSYACLIAPHVEQAKVPPLVLQTFIENTIKYSVSLDTPIKISLSIRHQKENESDFLYILITDTGPGFPDDVLEKLRNQQPLVGENGTRIGINNTIQRLYLLYGNNFTITFSNSTGSGATVELLIPYIIFEE